MKKEEADILVDQIRSIILNNPIDPLLNINDEEFVKLQEAIGYLSDCLIESNQFLRELSRGNLEIKIPSRHNFLTGSLKELHSGLRHLTWQADQVANGDYKQTVCFLGTFSKSFNKMIEQLSEREEKLKKQSKALFDTNELMKSIMDGLKDWVVVTSQETNDVIYSNDAASRMFYNPDTDEFKCGENCELMDILKNYSNTIEGENSLEYMCNKNKKSFKVNSFSVFWNNMHAFVHYIVDITKDKENQNKIEQMAYCDELTGLYNRRYFMSQLDYLKEEKCQFALCIVDLDGLKHANDAYGHTEGDIYLKEISHELKRDTRSSDSVCRIGGDEFAIIFQNCSKKAIVEKMEKINKQLASSKKEYSMSISYGVCEYDPQSNVSTADLLANTDKIMYEQKHKKRKNRD